MRPTITTFDSRGNITAIHYGKTYDELESDHKQNKCSWLCSFCYGEASEMLKKDLQSSNN
jgi:hypothetical protein